MIDVACVWTGTTYGVEYVERLCNMVARNLHIPHRFVCITDRAIEVPDGVRTVATTLPGWWAKMKLFQAAPWRKYRTLYFDLDTVITDNITPLAQWHGNFGICADFLTRSGAYPAWPCKYGSCVMSLAPEWGGHVWEKFIGDAQGYIRAHARYGDQQFIERVVPDATLLQDVMPDNYLVWYRTLTSHRPAGCAVVNFGGNNKPHNTEHQWVKDCWR